MRFRHVLDYAAPPEATRAIQREEWEDPTGGTVPIDSPGTPSEVAGTVTLRAEATGTREIVELDPRIKVPLVGSRLEKPLAERIAAATDAEHQVGVAYLEGRA